MWFSQKSVQFCLKLKVNVYSFRNATNEAYFRHKYSAQVEAAVNKQIQAEQQAAQDYLNMAVFFLHPCVSRPGAGGYFMRMYEEELEHMKCFIQYQLLRGGTTIVDCLNAPGQTNLTLRDAFVNSLAMEKAVTELLEGLVSTAESVKDYQCADYVTSMFLSEQMKAVNEISNHITELSRLCDDEHALYHYDLRLKERYPYSFKKLVSS